MNDTISYLSGLLSSTSLSLKKKSLIIDKPWTLIDEDGVILKFIFNRNRGLILLKDGLVAEGRWDYYAPAKALQINLDTDKLLLQEQYIDRNVLILRVYDRTDELFVLVNEETLPDLNILRYLNSVKINKFKIREKKLLNGGILQIYNGHNVKYLEDLRGLSIDAIDKHYNIIDLADGLYLTEDRRQAILIKKQTIREVKNNKIKDFNDNLSIEIIDGDNGNLLANINKSVTKKGILLPDQRLIDDKNIIYDIKNSQIAGIYFVVEYELKEGYHIQVEQKDDSKISKGDTIINSEPVSPIPDGAYKVKGKWRKIKVKNGVIV